MGSVAHNRSSIYNTPGLALIRRNALKITLDASKTMKTPKDKYDMFGPDMLMLTVLGLVLIALLVQSIITA